MSQMSLFSAAAREPRVADLDGLLAGPGQVVRRGSTARISVVVADGWRAEALSAQMALVSITAEREEADPATATSGTTTVRTPWLAELRPVADAWTSGAVKRPPAGWALDGSRLRWWCLAAGWGQPGLYSLALGASDEPAWQPRWRQPVCRECSSGRARTDRRTGSWDNAGSRGCGSWSGIRRTGCRRRHGPH
jgi:hypothetical protein